jgi:hypothetical protein
VPNAFPVTLQALKSAPVTSITLCLSEGYMNTANKHKDVSKFCYKF